MRIRPYWSVAVISFKEHLAYKSSFVLEVAGSLFTTLLTALLWYSLFRSTGMSHIHGYTVELMLTYILGVGIVQGMIHLNAQGDKQMWDINQGTLNNHLLKPWSPIIFWMIHDLARKVLMGGVMIGVALVVGIIFHKDIVLPQQVITILYFLGSLLAAAMIHFALFYVVTLLTFWTGLSWGFTFLVRVSMLVATGALIPIDVFPSSIQQLLSVLPLKFFGYVPMQLFLGRVDTTELIHLALQWSAWTAGLFLFGYRVYRKGLKKYGAYGG